MPRTANTGWSSTRRITEVQSYGALASTQVRNAVWLV